MLLEEYIKLNYKPRKSRQISVGGTLLHEVQEDVACFKAFTVCEPDYDYNSCKKSLKFVLEESFAHLLIKHMNEKGLDAPDVYKACNMTKFNFSHHLDPDHKPSKKSVLALCIGLKLGLKEATHFMARAGFAFSRANMRDVIVKYYISESIYDIDTINSSLYEHEEETIP